MKNLIGIIGIATLWGLMVGCVNNGKEREKIVSEGTGGDQQETVLTTDGKTDAGNNNSAQDNGDHIATDDAETDIEDDVTISNNDAFLNNDGDLTGDDDGAISDDAISEDEGGASGDDIADKDVSTGDDSGGRDGGDTTAGNEDAGSADDDLRYQIECELNEPYNGYYYCYNRFAVLSLGLRYCEPKELICVECYEDVQCGNGIECDQELHKCKDGDMSEKVIPCNLGPEFFCDNVDAYTAGLKYCDPDKKICVECFSNNHCKKGYYCDDKSNICVKGIKEIAFIPCKEKKDCVENPEADKAYLVDCFVEEGRCVECVDNMPCIYACDRETHQCYLPMPPECNPTCPQGDGWYCWDNGVETYCRQEGGYCEECDTQSDCRYVDSKCWAPAGVPAEVGGYCFKECTTDSDCDAFDKPNKPSTCHNGVCLCGWM